MVTSLSVASGEGEEVTLKVLRSKLEKMAEEKKNLKTKVYKLKGDLIYKSTQMKAINLHVEHVEEQNRKLDVDNGSLRITEREILHF